MNNLLGVWVTDSTDSGASELYGHVRMEFKDNGQLIYTICQTDREQTILMTYSVENNRLMTNQPSSPANEETVFAVFGDKLELHFQGVKTRYVRAD